MVTLDCSNANCLGGRVCLDDTWKLVVPDGKCCPICQPSNCNEMACEPLTCDKSHQVQHDGECCPVCATLEPSTDHCQFVECTPLTCNESEQTTADRECCPQCLTPDCHTVMCPDMKCYGGTVPVVPDGQCCPVCDGGVSTTDNCQSVDC